MFSEPASPDFSSPPGSPGRPKYLFEMKNRLEPVISIVTPFFNTGAIFLETLAALNAQSFQQWELLIVDDGSTVPESLELLRALTDPRIKVLRHPENRGLSAARNTGVAAARAPFIFLQDSDDLIEPSALEKFLWFLRTHSEFDFVTSFEVGFGDTAYLNMNGFHKSRDYLVENQTSPMVLLRKEVFGKAGGFDETNREGLEDWDFWLKCAENGMWGGTVPEFLKWYRRTFAQLNRWANWDQGDQQAKFLRERIERYPKIYSGDFPEPAPVERPLGDSPQNPLRSSSILLFLEDLSGIDEAYITKTKAALRESQLCIVSCGEVEQLSEQQLLTLTPDQFILKRFLPESAHLDFLDYLIQSREFQRVYLSAARGSFAHYRAFREVFGAERVTIVQPQQPFELLAELLAVR